MTSHVARSALVALIAFLFSVEQASACICGPPLSAETMPEADAVFSGRIVWYPRGFVDGGAATFRVDRVWRGDVPAYVPVNHRTMCNESGWWWGGRFVVFADGSASDPDGLNVLPCVGTTPVGQAQDVLERLGTGSAPPRSPIDALLLGGAIAAVGLVVRRRRRLGQHDRAAIGA